MTKISIIGFGNVAYHLAHAFENAASVELLQIYSRSGQRDSAFSDKIVSDLAGLLPADLYIVSVSDKAIAEVAAALPFSGRLVAHTAGSVPISAIGNSNRNAAFYPLQTFSKRKPLDFSEVPICIEAQNQDDLNVLESVASAVSGHVYRIDSNQRKALHVSAVFASNFSNHMYALANDICEQYQMPFDILKPLILETARKIETLDPRQAQTGPAIRKDENTIGAHLQMLADPNKKQIYELLTQSIQHGR